MAKWNTEILYVSGQLTGIYKGLHRPVGIHVICNNDLVSEWVYMKNKSTPTLIARFNHTIQMWEVGDRSGNFIDFVVLNDAKWRRSKKLDAINKMSR